ALAGVALLAAFAPAARAQDLQRLLPADTALALGLHELDGARDLLAAFVDPWVELGVGDALADALGGLDAAGLMGVPLDADDLDGELDLPPELEGLEVWDLLGREAWLGVSVSPFNPLPAVTLLARIDGETGARFDALLAREREGGALALTEGAIGFVVVEQGDGGFPLAAARDGDLLALSTNPDVLRGVLRQRQGSTEPAFGDAPSAAATLGALGEGQLHGFLDLGPLARSLAPFAAGLGFDASVARLLAVFETLGPVAGVTRLSETGTATTSLRRLEPAGGDAALLALLDAPGAAPRELLGWVPAGALSVQVSALDLQAWWRYLGDLVAGLRELGVPDLNRTVGDVLGVDLTRDLVGWTVPGLVVVQTGLGETAALGAPVDDLLGETVFGLRTSDDAAAEAGLRRLLDELAQRVALFADPFAAPGGNAVVAVRELTLAGVAARAYDVLPGLTLVTAVSDGIAWIATHEEGLERVLLAGLGGLPLPAPFAELADLVPAGATALTLSDNRASLAATGDSLKQQVQLLAGFAGGGIDFDAVERATDALEAYLEAIAPRFGGTVSWSGHGGAGELRSDERAFIDLR
ncbi:MAG: hypothetical protein ACNA8N_10665, partial [Trueperaceae bacterium]